MRTGLLYATAAFVAWGLFPLYFRALAHLDAGQVALHRSLWSAVFMWGVLLVLGRWRALTAMRHEPRRLGIFWLSGSLLFANWFVYVWAVNHGRVLDASLGYFINPLVNVLLGVLVLHERLTRLQWTAVALAAAGVLWLTVSAGTLPWVALMLAVSFGLYGLLRKTTSLGALEGFALETTLLAPVVLAALLLWTPVDARPGDVGALSLSDLGLLLVSGPLTALPLIAFAAGARRLPLATVGLVQYLSPTLQFLLGVWFFHEPFHLQRLIGFLFIWAALALYSASLLKGGAPRPPTTPVGEP